MAVTTRYFSSGMPMVAGSSGLGNVDSDLRKLPPTPASPKSTANSNSNSNSNSGLLTENKAVQGSSYVHPKLFEKVDAPWTDWLPCDQKETFLKRCSTRPSNCTIQVEANNNHGIGNALMTSYVKHAKNIFQQGCAPEITDKVAKPQSGGFRFKFLDYVNIPEYIPAIGEDEVMAFGSNLSKCVTFAITQPKELVATKVKNILSQLYDKTNRLPLVAVHLRSGWSDEMSARQAAWNALGSCNDYRDKYYAHPPWAFSEIDLEGMVLDIAAAADKMFGPKQWRLYVASDAPAARAYVSRMLESRTAGPIVWLEGTIGHNYGGIGAATMDQNIQVSVNALAEVVVMSEADFFVILPSKFPTSAKWRSICPQRFIEMRGHPRHDLAILGNVLTRALSKDGTKEAWSPNLTAEEERTIFWKALPKGHNNPCAQDGDPFRACFCLLKLGHA